jgi:hypothetical protein
MNGGYWHRNWLVDILLRVGFLFTLMWVLINGVLRLVPEDEGFWISITTTRPLPTTKPTGDCE